MTGLSARRSGHMVTQKLKGLSCHLITTHCYTRFLASLALIPSESNALSDLTTFHLALELRTPTISCRDHMTDHVSNT